MEKRKLSELNLLDDFLFHQVVSRGEKGERVCQLLLEMIFDRPFQKVKVIPQKTILGVTPNNHGIRLDAYLEVGENSLQEVSVEPGIYDIEPNLYHTGSEAKRSRYYHALIDSRILRRGENYDMLRNVTIIMIVPYDPFGKNRMVYTFSNHCEEDPAVPYEDGQKTIYLYTKGKAENASLSLRSMLKYMEESTAENADNSALRGIQQIVEEVKNDEEVGVKYMKSWEREWFIRSEGKREGREEGKISMLIELICKKLQKGKSAEVIAEELEEDVEMIQSIIKLAADYAPDYDISEIYEAYAKQQGITTIMI